MATHDDHLYRQASGSHNAESYRFPDCRSAKRQTLRNRQITSKTLPRKEAKLMKPLILQSRSGKKLFHGVIAISFIGLLSPVFSVVLAQQAQSQVMNTTTSDTEKAPKLSSGELDSLVGLESVADRPISRTSPLFRSWWERQSRPSLPVSPGTRRH